MILRRARNLALLLGAVAGCEGLANDPAPEGTALTPQHLNGTVNWDPAAQCTNLESKVLEAMSVAKSYVVTNPGPLIECLKEQYWSGPTEQADHFETYPDGTLKRPSNGYPEYVMARLRENLPTTIGCGADPHTSLLSQTEEKFQINISSINAGPVPAAGAILHEASHNKGLEHHMTSISEAQTFPSDMLQKCLFNVHENKVTKVRSDAPQETRLATVGLDTPAAMVGASWPDQNCSGTKFAAGLHGRLSGKVVAVALTCKPKNVDSYEDMPLMGNAAAPQTFLQRCNPGELMVGVAGVAMDRVQTLAARCQPESSIAAFSTAGVWQPLPVGQVEAKNTDWVRQCPAGMAVKALKIRYMNSINAIELTCQSYANPEAVETFWAEGGGAGSGYDSYEVAPGRAALTSVYGYYNGSFIRRLGAKFSRTFKAGAGNDLDGQWFSLPAHGGIPHDATESTRDCPAGQAVVALDIHSSGAVSAVNGLVPKCAPAMTWTDPANPPVTVTPLSAIGSTAGTKVAATCPRPYLMTGWNIVASDRVGWVTPVCRKFPVSSCFLETDAQFCARLGKNCGHVSGTDTCGLPRAVGCGICTSPQTCGGGGIPNVCGSTACTPESNTTFCARLGKNCGQVSGTDNCGAARTVATCGSCTSPQTCGGGGTANVCGGSATFDLTQGGTAAGTGTACNSTSETVSKAYDNRMTSADFSKWCVTSAPSTGTPISTSYDFSGTQAFVVKRYTITTANDTPTRDPKNWTLQGCPGSCSVGSGTGWVTLDTRTNQFVGAARYKTNTYNITNTTAYQQYRLRFTANHGNTRFQLAEVQLFGP